MRRRAMVMLALLILILAVAAAFGVKKLKESRREQANRPNPIQSMTPAPLLDSKLKDEMREEAKGKLSQVKIASHYERITDGASISRSIEDVVEIFKETKTELVLRSFWRWAPVPESPTDIIPGVPANLLKEAADGGYTYQQYQEAADKIKKEIPNMILVGAISAQRVNKMEIDPITREIIGQDKTWQMAFDPGKWNLGVSKEEAQCKVTRSWHWIKSDIECPSGYNPKNAPAYFPDITNKEYQELLLDIAKKQIDYGADAIWIDMLYSNANYLQNYTKDPNHPAVKASFDSSSKIIDDIRNYGYSKGKYIYVGTWWNFVGIQGTSPDVDFVTATLTSEEVAAKKINESDWKLIQDKIEDKLGNIPVFVFIDHGNDGLPLGIFSQKLTSKEQNEFLKGADSFFTGKGMVFVYPVHGGFMGQSAKNLAFGKEKVYDSLAPEFDTYDTIKELANKKQ